jgi:aldose sugar dehydrogenase
MKKLIFFLFLLNYSYLYASEIKFEKIIDILNKPWSLSFIDNENIILTEKNGKIFTLNLQKKDIKEIKHNLSFNN